MELNNTIFCRQLVNGDRRRATPEHTAKHRSYPREKGPISVLGLPRERSGIEHMRSGKNRFLNDPTLAKKARFSSLNCPEREEGSNICAREKIVFSTILPSRKRTGFHPWIAPREKPHTRSTPLGHYQKTAHLARWAKHARRSFTHRYTV